MTGQKETTAIGTTSTKRGPTAGIRPSQWRLVCNTLPRLGAWRFQNGAFVTTTSDEPRAQRSSMSACQGPEFGSARRSGKPEPRGAGASIAKTFYTRFKINFDSKRSATPKTLNSTSVQVLS